jgi:peptidoglycan hydrolase-like protein with peptidoglycan-binding domain
VHSLKFPNDLQFGNKHNGVRILQEWLIAKKLLGEGFNTGYFGPLTKKAVMAYQKSMGITPTGYFGWVTRQMIDTMGE